MHIYQKICLAVIDILKKKIMNYINRREKKMALDSGHVIREI